VPNNATLILVICVKMCIW